MIKLLFVCHGNICRSPIAEFIMKDLLKKKGVANSFEIASAATSTEELGNPVYPPARQLLKQNGLDCSGKFARQITKEDYQYYDYIIVMDSYNLRSITRFAASDALNKVSLLMDYTDRPGDVADPWYSRDFQKMWEDINEGCRGLLDFLQKKC